MTGSRADHYWLQAHPDLNRVAGTTTVFLRGEPEQLLELTPDTFELLGFFSRPRPLSDLLPDPTPQHWAVIEKLLVHKILLRCDQETKLPPAPEPQLHPVLPSFANVPRWRCGQMCEGAVVVVGAPFDNHTLACYRRGSAFGPAAIRRASQQFRLDPSLATGAPVGICEVEQGRLLAADTTILDGGDLLLFPGVSGETYFDGLTRALQQIRGAGAKWLLLGGDHSVTLAAVRALHGERMGILHVDAHTDYGPIRYAGDLHHGNVMRHVHNLDGVEDIVVVGIRGLQARPRESGYRAFSPREMRALGGEDVRRLLRPGLPYYVSLDIDALDPSIAPATGVPEPDGLGLAELRGFLNAALTDVDILAADLTEVSGTHAETDLTARCALQILFELLDLM